ncbi:formylmethanofuran dehydrogenase subunit B [Geoglobus acetivorans]|uniref:Formylmethanofuran dehydrogenase subunit B n=1 Tax=Geoglobus acetivorans TaxID=565033 RepID=A0A0A7GC67_GEOAI|nr:formylmethanofuran dehydrogenase subunit B [Geoglobus acetivorans]
MYTCAGCSCLCDDIEIVTEKDDVKTVYNACRRGAGIFLNYRLSRTEPKVDGKIADFEQAIEKAQDIIQNSENLAIYGLDTTTLEVQELAIKLAEKKEAYIDDNSTFCLGDFVEMILKGELPSTTLEEVKDNAYVIAYWGSDAYHSLSRHMSRYTYYPRGGKRQRGYEEDRFLVVIDVRKTHTAKLAKKNARFLQIRDDLELIEAFNQALDGKAPSIFVNDIPRILKEMEKADFNVIFGGLGLKYGLKGKYEAFKNLIARLNERTGVYFIPAGCHPNMRGFNELMFDKTGEINRYSFNEQRSSDEFAFYRLLENDAIDTAVIIGTDPLNSLPFEYAKKLAKINTIVIDPRETFTGRFARVVLPSAIAGVETGGTMVRSDGVRVELKPLFEKEINDEAILSRLLEVV